MTIDEEGNPRYPLEPAIPPHDEGAEQVLCTPAWLVHSQSWGPGILTDSLETLFPLLTSPDRLAFLDRPGVETNPDWVQVVPYCLLVRDGRVFRYRRKGSEGRLTGLYSVGVGGHVNPVDLRGDDLGVAYWAGLQRELDEEVGLYLIFEALPKVSALIYDASNEVGRAHLGLVHVLNLHPKTALSCDDPALQEGRFVPIADVVRECSDRPALYETWSVLSVLSLLS